MACMLKDKLKTLKVVLKVWNKEVFRNLDAKIKVCSVKLQSLELTEKEISLSHEELMCKLQDSQDLWDLIQCRGSQIL